MATTDSHSLRCAAQVGGLWHPSRVVTASRP